MIPTELYAISWVDIESLIAGGREEDDTIEFKRAFSGGGDLLAMSESAKKSAIDSIAREVIGFLNTRGGDVVIGLREASGTHPRAEEITPIDNAAESADRLARGLAELIEPAQTNVSVRAIMHPDEAGTGVIFVRVRASLRAPHRSKRSKDCFTRRGTQSVSMPMDEVQDLTLYRTRIRTEQLDLLERQFDDFSQGRSGQHRLPTPIFHVMAVTMPFADMQLTVEQNILEALSGGAPTVYRSDGTAERLDVAFRGLSGRWKPMLRGRKLENYDHRTSPDGADVQFASKRIKENGSLAFEYAAAGFYQGAEARIHVAWVVGFLAELATDIAALARAVPAILPSTLRLAFRVDGTMLMGVGSGMWASNTSLPTGLFAIPDFTVSNEQDLNSFFQAAQVDLMSLCELEGPAQYSLHQPDNG